MNPEIILPVDKKFPITFEFSEAPKWYVDVFKYPHNGVDQGCPIGTPVKICDDGVISFADDIPDWDGKGIIVKHSWGVSLYWHLSRLFAKYNQAFNKGEMIGYSGRTGFVTGPHHHFGTKVWGVEVPGMRGWSDPLDYVSDLTPAPIAPPVQIRHHRVMPGQTLWGLAVKYYGNGLLWRRIYLANKNKIKNPNLIHPLQRLMIP